MTAWNTKQFARVLCQLDNSTAVSAYTAKQLANVGLDIVTADWSTAHGTADTSLGNSGWCKGLRQEPSALLPGERVTKRTQVSLSDTRLCVSS